MDAFTSAALVGTTRLGAKPALTGTPVDALVPETEAERAILLRAGALAVYQDAGQIAAQVEAPPAPAPVETLAQCSARAASIMQTLLSGRYPELIPEAFDRLIRAGQRLPFDLLPTTLSSRVINDHRELARQVIGERGRWLAQFNKSWAWAVAAPVEGGELPPDAEELWQEGALSQRIEVLRRLRAIDPDRAREWLAEAWKKEKAETRLQMLQTFEDHLSEADLPFMETALDDRAANVKAQAREYLRRIPNSAIAQRMITRADAMITWNGKELTVKPPTTIEKDADWERDGLEIKPPGGVGKRAWWLTQVIAYVPPAHWERTFATTPEIIITAALGTDYEHALIEGWSRATITYDGTGWEPMLWQWWLEPKHDKTLSEVYYVTLRNELLTRLPHDEAEAKVMSIITSPDLMRQSEWDDAITGLPRPWSDTFANAYMRGFRDYVAKLAKFEDFIPAWDNSLTHAAMSIAPTEFAAAIATIEFPDLKTWRATQLSNHFETFVDIIHLRQRLIKEIPLR